MQLAWRMCGSRSGQAQLRLDLVPHQLRDIRPADVLHRADAGRRGHVDLGEPAADHVDADEQQPALAQMRPEPRADLALARRQLGFLRRAAAHHVGAQVVRRRHAVDRARIFAVDQDDALVAVLHGREEGLHHPLLAEGHGEHVVERAEIEIVARHAEHRAAAMAVERLHHDVAVLGAERLDLGEVARDQRRRHQVGKFGDEHLLGRVAHARRIVHHEGLRVHALEQMRGGDVGEVERRVLAQQDHVELGQLDAARLTQGEMIAEPRRARSAAARVANTRPCTCASRSGV